MIIDRHLFTCHLFVASASMESKSPSKEADASRVYMIFYHKVDLNATNQETGEIMFVEYTKSWDDPGLMKLDTCTVVPYQGLAKREWTMEQAWRIRGQPGSRQIHGTPLGVFPALGQALILTHTQNKLYQAATGPSLPQICKQLIDTWDNLCNGQTELFRFSSLLVSRDNREGSVPMKFDPNAQTLSLRDGIVIDVPKSVSAPVGRNYVFIAAYA
jgi:hypothetical protein